MSTPAPTFLSAHWRHLIMLNHAVDPALLAPLVPEGVVLDTHEDRCWVSIVAFLFHDTRLKGLPIPGHRDFEELNLRYYVRRDVPDTARGLDHRRGVAFVKEVVPRFAIAAVARLLYNEQYVSMPMHHRITDASGAARPGDAVLAAGDRVAIGWGRDGDAGTVAATVAGPARPLVPGSHAHFIAEHYWGYAHQRGGGTVEYEVRHPPWSVHDVEDVVVDGDLGALYGEELGAALAGPPDTAFLAVGSAVEVGDGRRL